MSPPQEGEQTGTEQTGYGKTQNPVWVVGGVIGAAVGIGVLIAGVFLYSFSKNGKPLPIRPIDEQSVVPASSLQGLFPEFSIRTEAETLTRRRMFDGTEQLAYRYIAPAPQSLLIHSELRHGLADCPDVFAVEIERAKTELAQNIPGSEVHPIDVIVPWGTDHSWLGHAYLDGNKEKPTGFAFVGCDGERLYKVVVSSERFTPLSADLFFQALSASIDAQGREETTE